MALNVLLKEKESKVVSNYSPNILYIGIKSAIGTATSGQLKDGILNKEEAEDFFGRTSHIYQPLQTAFDLIKDRFLGNDSVEISAIGFDENVAGVKATANITVTGSATETKTIKVILVSAKYYTFNIEVATGDLQGTIAQKIVDEINANISIPVVASINGVNTNQIDLVSTFKSNIGNQFHIEIDGTIQGSSFVITEFTGGTTTPDISIIKTLLVDKQYNYIVIDNQFLEADSTIREFFTNEARINRPNDNVAGILFTTITDTYANHHTNLPLLNTIKCNGVFTVATDNSTLSKGNYTKEFEDNITSAFVVEQALTYTPEANVNDFMQNSVTGLGSPSNLPVATTDTIMLNLVRRLDKNNGFSFDENKQLQKDGAIILDIDKRTLNWYVANNTTTYLKQSTGADADITDISQWVSFLFMKSFFYENCKLRFKKTTMTSGQAVVNTQQMTIEDVKTYLMSLVNTLATEDENGVVIGIIRNDPVLLQQMEDYIDKKLVFIFKSGKIQGEILPYMVQAIKDITLTIIQSNN